MKSFECVIQDECGIHARPAGQLVKQAQTYASDIVVAKGKATANAKKLFALIGLCVKKGDKVTITAEGPDEADAIQGI